MRAQAHGNVRNLIDYVAIPDAPGKSAPHYGQVGLDNNPNPQNPYLEMKSAASMIWKEHLASCVRKSLEMLIDYEVIHDPPGQSGPHYSQLGLDNNQNPQDS